MYLLSIMLSDKLVAQCHQAYLKVSILILFRVRGTGVGGSSQGAKKLI